MLRRLPRRAGGLLLLGTVGLALAGLLAGLLVGLVPGLPGGRLPGSLPGPHPPRAVAAGCGSPGVPVTWCAATSRPRRDSVYPAPSHPAVDALHYLLRLRWQPAGRRLDGDEVLVFRAARRASTVRLALADRVGVGAAWLDGRRVPHAHTGGTLVVRRPVSAGSVHRLRVRYTTAPRAAAPPRAQRNADGVFHTPAGDVFTNDEPVGASTWYAVDDQPSDKAFYDFRLEAPAPRVGVANGRLLSRRRDGGEVVTRFHLDRPAASYLVTVEVGRYRMTRLQPLHGVPLTLWTPRDRPGLARPARFLRQALAFDERQLGPYPFATLSLVVVASYHNGMENQTLVTLGADRGLVNPEDLVHEVAHHWYGDAVTPRDWRDVWMNEGMATYLQDVWDAHHYRIGIVPWLRLTRVPQERRSRREYGPPADYDPAVFAAGNVYFGPELMWQELREKVGSRAFWSMVRAWPAGHRDGSAGRAEYLSWMQHRLHRDLGALFHAWLLGTQSPRFR